MIAHAVKAHQLSDWRTNLIRHALNVQIEFLARGAVFKWDAKRQHPRSVVGFPPEQAARQHFFVWAGAHKYVGVHAALSQYLRKRSLMPEAVHVVADLRHHAEALFEVALRIQPMPRKRLTAGN